MKKLMVVMMSLASLGVFADQDLELEARFESLDNRLKQLEKAEEKERSTRRKIGMLRNPYRPSVEAPVVGTNYLETTRIDEARVDAFLQEHFGVRFGDSINCYTNKVKWGRGRVRHATHCYLNVIKGNGHLNTAIGLFCRGKLWGVDYVAISPDVSDLADTDVFMEGMEKYRKDCEAVAVELNIDPKQLEARKNGKRQYAFEGDAYAIDWHQVFFTTNAKYNDDRYPCVRFVNKTLWKELEAEDKAFIAEESAKREKQLQESIRSMLGYEIGQKVAEDCESGRAKVELQKKYRYFATLIYSYVDGCISSLDVRFETKGKYLFSSLEAEAEATRRDLEAKLGIVFGKSRHDSVFGTLITSPASLPNTQARQNGWLFEVDVLPQHDGIIRMTITNEYRAKELETQAQKKKEAKQVALPVFEEK